MDEAAQLQSSGRERGSSEAELRTLLNDLAAAVEVHSEGRWTVLYPEAACQVVTEFQIRLREDATIRTTARCGHHDLEVRASEIQDFGKRAKRWVQDEQEAVRKEEEEALHRESLQKKKVKAAKRQSLVFWVVCFAHLVSLMVSESARDLTQSLVAYAEPEYRSFLESCQFAAASLGSFALFFCVSHGDRLFPSWQAELSATLGCASFMFYHGCLVAFIHFQEDLLMVCATGITVGWIARHLHSWYSAAFVAIFFLGYIVERSILRPKFAYRPFWDAFRDSAIALGISLLVFCISGCEPCRSRRGMLTIYILSAIVTLVVCVAFCAGVAVPLSFAYSPFLGILSRDLFLPGSDVRVVLEEMARRNTRNKTIMFEGTVSRKPGKACVVSWPGKYVTAWDHLVASARAGQTSAAVVFLPPGTKNFGKHSPVPAHEGIDGRCWCQPLYGERKPWGCRWWALWIQNVETAVKHRAELQVYFFEGACGKGKVASFETAGQEHLQRETLLEKMYGFEDSDSFRDAFDAGLENLSRRERYDSSSQYSREKYRLFLQWLPDSERQFLQDSEGLGNSQKAEVAWLEKKGYRYTAVDISRWLTQPAEDRENLWAWKPETNSPVGHPVVCNELPLP